MPKNRGAARRAAAAQRSIGELEALCATWNSRHPVGTFVRYYRRIHPREDLAGVFRTRSAAQVLSGHTAVVWLEGVSGCVCLDAVEPVKEAPCSQ
jgi:hypothetical protein